MPVLQFKGKSAIESYHHVVPHHRLEFDGKLSVLPKGEKPNLDGNLVIEGDNLLALKALLPTHAGRVKCIYIDPPYNTGNEGWVYNDNLTQPQFKEWIGQTVGKEGEDACRHDKWCCMMYPRLELLKELLRDDGIIFVSIDYVEVSNLRLLMDEVFGPENFLADIAWEKRYTRSNNANLFYSLKDTILVYRRSADVDFLREARTEKSDAGYSNPDDDARGPWMTSSYVNPATKEQRKNLVYPIRRPADGAMIEHETHAWKYDPDTHAEHVREERLWWGEDGLARYPRQKIFRSDNGLVPIDVWDWQTTGTSDEGGEAVKRIFGRLVFDNPKPVNLVKRMLDLATDPTAGHIVLDSCAGSGTTGHAVLEKNQEDQGNRTFVLVQQPHDTKEQEKERLNLCRDITAERVRRVIKGYDWTGTNRTVVFDEKLTLSHLRNAPDLLAKLADAEKVHQPTCDKLIRDCSDGFLRLIAEKQIDGKAPGIGGSFAYVRLGDRLFGEYRDLGEKPPSFEEIAKYVFYTETSRQCDLKKIDAKTGHIGETEAAGGTSYYLLYTPNRKEDCEMSLETLKALLKKDTNRNWVIYCEKIWLHQDQLRKFEQENGKHVRPMLVPFNLK